MWLNYPGNKILVVTAFKSTKRVKSRAQYSIDCSQSTYFSVGFSRPVRFDGAAAILVCKSERDLGPTPAPLGSLPTLPRSRSLLQTKMAGVLLKRTGLENPTEK